MRARQDTNGGNRRVLLVEDTDEVRESLHRLLSMHFDVCSVRSAEDALEALATNGPFSVLISDHGLPGRNGANLLQEVQRRHEGTERIVLTGLADLDLAVDALHRGGAFRFLTRPCAADELRQAVEEAIEAGRERRAERQESDELHFAIDSFRDFTDRLEGRVLAQTRMLRRMHELAIALNGADGEEAIAVLAAEAVFDVLEGRGVLVQVWTPDRKLVEAARGPEMSSELYSQPLSSPDGPMGEIVVDRLGPDGAPLGATELDILASIASSTAVAAHNEIRRRERDQAQYATIFALARLSEQRDNETGKHLERVALYCRLVAQGLRDGGCCAERISDGWIDDLERSAPLHDIGKVGIPDSILMKPGRLTAEEWEIMKTHAQIGATTLKSVIAQNNSQGFLEMGHDIALCHHEKWDGSGYPKGLEGQEIPLAARILALADVYDALTTVRPYKDAWTHEAARRWIREGSGRHFDPLVVGAFLQGEKQMNAIRARLADSVDEVAALTGDRRAHRA